MLYIYLILSFEFYLLISNLAYLKYFQFQNNWFEIVTKTVTKVTSCRNAVKIILILPRQRSFRMDPKSYIYKHKHIEGPQSRDIR